MLSEKIKEIKHDRTSGASQIARNALGVLRFFVQTSKHESCRGFKEDFIEGGRKLFEARPNMAPVQNLVAQITYEVGTTNDDDVVSVRKFAASQIDRLCKESEAAVKICAELGATIIGGSECLASCSDSSTVCETYRVTKQAGKNFRVYVAESKSDDGMFRYGEIMATFLKSIGVPAKVFPDNEIHSYVQEAECVLVGADSVLFDGSVINGTPTCELAVAAEEFGIPFYSVCETSKVNTLSYLGRKVELKAGFDLAPANLITGIVTEKGVLDSKAIVDVMRSKSKFFEIFDIT